MMGIIRSCVVLGVCMCLVVFIKHTDASGVFEIEFLDYEDDCSEGGGYCDALFYFSLGTPSCSTCYASVNPRESEYFQANSIDLQRLGSIQGLPNPWRVSVSSFDSYVRVTIRVMDSDYGDDDDMVTFTEDLLTSGAFSTQWTENSDRRTVDGYNYRIRYRYRIYCDNQYYTSHCDVYCVPTNSSMGHYTCDTSNGNKICFKGWHGDGCNIDIDECSQGFCSKGLCNNIPGSAQCICDSYHTGSDCSLLINQCNSSPCLNGGTCYMLPSEPRHSCTCQTIWTGVNCETRIDPCASQPCLNHGTCLAHPTELRHSCTCQATWTGVDCETRIDPCALQPCLNNGTCLIHPTQWIALCSCPQGWQGLDCGSRTDPCTSQPCVNGGTCILKADSSLYYCKCHEAYSGSNCQFLHVSIDPLVG